jgi:hypothetical protein
VDASRIARSRRLHEIARTLPFDVLPSVSPEADWDLTEEATYDARDGGAELENAFIIELTVSLLFCARPHEQRVRLFSVYRRLRNITLATINPSASAAYGEGSGINSAV